MVLVGYCRACSQTLLAPAGRDYLCPSCRPSRFSILLRWLSPRAERELLASFELESVLRLRRLQRRVRAGVVLR